MQRSMVGCRNTWSTSECIGCVYCVNRLFFVRISEIYNRMQSYKLHIVSEHLQDRHPYLESPFKARYNKSEVHYAVFDRSIPKLIEILLMNDIETHKYRDALITLN